MNSSPCIIELNDIGVVASSAELESVNSPGYVLMQAGKLVVGKAAQTQARLHPHQVNNRFWQRLSLDSISHFDDLARHHADLAYAHLLHLHELAGEPEEVIFAVPGNYSNEQLSVLLGVARQCPFQAVGLVDFAVAAAAGVELAGDVVHIDLQLHQAVLTKISVAGEIKREAVQTVEGAGLLSMYDRWAHIIADAFIEQCRFDPLHSATTEQYIYDRLPQYLFESELLVDIEVPQGSSIHRARVERGSLLQVGANIWQQLLDRAATMGSTIDHSLMGHKWSAVPSVETFSPGSTLLTAEATASVCLEHADLIRSDGEAVSFVTRLPSLKGMPPGKSKVTATTPAAATTATHVLVNSTAYPLTAPCFLQDTEDGVTCRRDRQSDSRCALSLQDKQVRLQVMGDEPVWLDDRALCAGEPSPTLAAGVWLRLTTAGEKIKLIQVSADGKA
jgi:hypothetical protein